MFCYLAMQQLLILAQGSWWAFIYIAINGIVIIVVIIINVMITVIMTTIARLGRSLVQWGS